MGNSSKANACIRRAVSDIRTQMGITEHLSDRDEYNSVHVDYIEVYQSNSRNAILILFQEAVARFRTVLLYVSVLLLIM